jgi:UDP-4-amino-4,6-dideoxy-N-acetyl-beta-L-altrosamine N-acetyltransferase
MREIKFLNILYVSNELKEKVRKWRNKEEIRKSMFSQHIITKKEHFRWIESLEHRKDWKFWIVFFDDVPIGCVYLQNIDSKKMASEEGFYIGEESYKGQGLSKCILFKLLGIFFDEMKFKIIFSKIISKNIVALNLNKKFRFKEIDRLPFGDSKEIIISEFSEEDWIKWKEYFKNESIYKNSK